MLPAILEIQLGFKADGQTPIGVKTCRTLQGGVMGVGQIAAIEGVGQQGIAPFGFADNIGVQPGI